MENDNTNTEYNETSSNNTVDNTSTNTSVGSPAEYNEKLDNLHSDLGIICSFLVFFTLVILLKYVYKFFNMFFQEVFIL